MKKIILLGLVLHLSASTLSQTCCSGGVPLSNNIGLPILDKGNLQIGLYYDYNNLNTLKKDTELLNDNSRLRITHSILFNVGYSFTDNLSIEGLFTWVNQRRRIRQFGNSNLEETSGIGDAILIAKYRVLNNLSNEFSLGFGVKVPLGSSTKVNSQGFLIVADLQPGSNALDYIFMTTYAKNLRFRKSMNISSRLIYRLTGTNRSYLGSSNYRFGNELQAFLSITDQFLIGKQIISPSLSLKYRTVVKDKINKVNLENTGGNWLFLIPNFTINITPYINFSTNIEIPIYANVKGTQLTPTYRLNSGISIQILKKTNFNPIL